MYNLKLAMVVNRIDNMKQYFYLVGHDVLGDFVPDTIFLQEHDAIKWGRRRALQDLDSRYKLYKQEITRTSKLEFAENLRPYLSPENAIRLASKYHLEAEVQADIDSGMSPIEACREWDIL